VRVRAGAASEGKGKEFDMPAWFLVVLLGVLAFAVLLAILMANSRRSAGGQNTTIIERDPSRDGQKTTVVESD